MNIMWTKVMSLAVKGDSITKAMDADGTSGESFCRGSDVDYPTTYEGRMRESMKDGKNVCRIMSDASCVRRGATRTTSQISTSSGLSAGME